MYEKYLSMQSVPAGRILEAILKNKHLTQKEVADMSNEYPQRIYEFIKGTRKFTIKASLSIEKTLGIDIEGFFVKLQTNHEIYCYKTNKELLIHPDLSKFSKALFWDTQLEKINWIRNKEWVIKRTFEYGNEQEIKEVIKFYGEEDVKSILLKINDKWNKESRIGNIQKYLQ